MNKFKQCTYTMILIFTCFIASPMIFKQIWTTSAEKKKENKAKIEDIDIRKGYNEGTEIPSADAFAPGTPGSTAPQNPSAGASETVSNTVIFTPPSSESPSTAQPVFVESDFSYFDNALFIGDSRTVGIRDYGSLGNADFSLHHILHVPCVSAGSLSAHIIHRHLLDLKPLGNRQCLGMPLTARSV